MKPFLFVAVALILASQALLGVEKPNILFIIADDASRHFGEAYGCRWVKTPHLDRLAKQGLVLDQAYTPTSKCAPSRAAILTGRNPWQLEEAANHQPYFPAHYMAFSEALVKAEIPVGSEGKTWGPGDARKADGSPRDFGFNAKPAKGDPVPAKAFSAFLKQRTPGKPFFYWFGSHYPHRAYKLDSGLAAGKKPTDIDRVPAYWPDNEIVRRDMLDYAVEVEAFDAQVGSLLAALEASGETAKTLIVVTSDHGMPFPRVKGHTYDDAHHIPMILHWPDGLAKPGRRSSELISFIDLAPTFLELLGVEAKASGMAPITGRSFTDLIRGETQVVRDCLIIGRERNDVLARPGSPAGLGYPVRAIRQGSLLYIINFEPNRWPCGEVDLGLKDTDASPTKALLEAAGPSDPFWQHAFGKRPAEQLFDISRDPDCVNNLAADPAFSRKREALRESLMAELQRQKDPRVLGQGEMFDHYQSPRTMTAEKTRKKPKAPLP